MQTYISADLYETAFLLVHGAQFRRVKEYYRNHAGKSFSIIELEGVTFDILQKMYDPNSTVNFHKFKAQRKRIKQKVEKYAKEHDHKEITSTEAYRIHKELEKQYTQMKEFTKGSGPKRVITENEEQNNNGTLDLSKIPDSTI